MTSLYQNCKECNIKIFFPEVKPYGSIRHACFVFELNEEIAQHKYRELILGNIGSPERLEFTVIGYIVNVASRFSGLAVPEQTLVTRESLKMVHSGVRYSELKQASVKGKTEKFEVLGMFFLVRRKIRKTDK